MKLSKELRPPKKKQDKSIQWRKKQKEYLNAKEQEELMVLAAFAGKLEEMVETWVSVGADKERVKEARKTLAFLYRTMDSFVAHIQDEAVIGQVVKKLKYTSIKVNTGG